MLIFPSMDLHNGNVVGLYRGNYDDMKVYSTNPMEIVDDLVNMGSKCIHINDMGSSHTGKMETEIVSIIKTETPLFVQVGGGINKMVNVEKYFSAGADRLVLGNVALNNETFIKEALKEYKERIAVSIDIKDGEVPSRGFSSKSTMKAVDFALKIQELGVQTIICTDVGRAGSKKGMNYELFQSLEEKLSVNIIASGGVGSLEDILQLCSMNIFGVIIGRAYYDGAIYIRQAIKLAN